MYKEELNIAVDNTFFCFLVGVDLPQKVLAGLRHPTEEHPPGQDYAC